METVWHSDNFTHDEYILSGDIGGTNSTFAIVGKTGSKFEIIVSNRYPSQEISGPLEPIRETWNIAKDKIGDFKIKAGCLSAAGPKQGNYCQPTNIEWDIRGDELEKETGINIILINDFEAISYSLPLLDVNNPEQLIEIPHIDQDQVNRSGNTVAVVGAGTGLGVGFGLISSHGYIAGASEGGHCGFQDFDIETTELRNFLIAKYDSPPDAENYVSGQGINNLFDYFIEGKKVAITETLQNILDTPRDDRPALISQAADTDQTCSEIMALFVKLYGKFAGEIAAAFMPNMGMFIGGGIVTKNEKLFTRDNTFISYFEENFCDNINRVLKTIPVYIIRNYSVSLIGAAHAAYCI